MPLLDGATYVFDRANNDYSWFHDMTERQVHFVGRMKSNAKFEVIEEPPVTGNRVLEEQLIRLSSPSLFQTKGRWQGTQLHHQ